MKLLSHYAPESNIPTKETKNRKNYDINELLLYSHRDTVYTSGTYPSNLHFHDYWELVVYEEGDVRYICDFRVFYPFRGCILAVPPGTFHMSAINKTDTRYVRHAFYFYPEAFSLLGIPCLGDFLNRADGAGLFSFRCAEENADFLSLLKNLDRALSDEKTPLDHAPVVGYALQIFYFLNKKVCEAQEKRIDALPENLLHIQRYIEENFAELNGVSDIARRFFYSREHLSRLFKKYLDISVTDYIAKCRVLKSCELITAGVPVLDAAYRVGFGSPSAFIKAFRKETGVTPSEYRKLKKEAAAFSGSVGNGT